MPTICPPSKPDTQEKPETQEIYQVVRRPYHPQQQIKTASNLARNPFREYQPQTKYDSKALNSDAVKVIKDIICSSELDDTSSLQQKLYAQLDGYEDILGSIAINPNELINVCAMAARLFFAKIKSPDYAQRNLPSKNVTAILARLIAEHDIPLIRLGAVLGLADAQAWGDVRKFLEDPHSKVRLRAEELLEDAD